MSDDEAEMAALRRNQRFQVSAASKISEARKTQLAEESQNQLVEETERVSLKPQEVQSSDDTEAKPTSITQNVASSEVSYLAQFRKKKAKLPHSVGQDKDNKVAGLAQISDAELVQRTSLLN